MVQNVVVVVGGFFGDEAKGKFCAALAKHYNPPIAVRGGVSGNAGHTLYYNGVKYGLRMIPSAVLDCPSATLAIGPGVIVDPEILVAECAALGISKERIVVDGQCCIVEKRHIEAERADEYLMKTIGSTGSGGGAALMDHVMRRATLARDCQLLKDNVTIGVVADLIAAVPQDQTVLVEGTQATFLSLYHGDYPFTTSKDVCASSLCADVGVGPLQVRDVIVIFKAFVTRVGKGPLPGEIFDQDEVERLGWSERGTVTGRQRRAAPFNAEIARRAVRLNSANKMAISKVDVLFPEAKGLRTVQELETKAPLAMEWLRATERAVGCKLFMVGTGPYADETVFFD
jgi:adenylosuccinate synthase